MEKDQVLNILRQHAPELQADGLVHLRLFGSVARGEATPQSDIDLLADFAPDLPLTLLRLSSLQDQLCALLGQPVELSSSSWMKDRVRERALSEAIIAY